MKCNLTVIENNRFLPKLYFFLRVIHLKFGGLFKCF